MKRWLLPRYQGPKLAPFPFKDPVNPELTISGYLGGGLHSHVFEAELDGKKYALKLVSPLPVIQQQRSSIDGPNANLVV